MHFFFYLSSRAHHLYLLCSFKRNVKGINHFVLIVVEKVAESKSFWQWWKESWKKKKKKNLMHAACSPHKVEESDNKDFINGFISHQSLIFLLILAKRRDCSKKKTLQLIIAIKLGILHSSHMDDRDCLKLVEFSIQLLGNEKSLPFLCQTNKQG